MNKLWAIVTPAALGIALPAWAANPPLDCQSPKAPPGYTVYGVGRASSGEATAGNTRETLAHDRARADLLGRMCPDRCGCEEVALQIQDYTWGTLGDQVCTMVLLPPEAAQQLRAQRDPQALAKTVAATVATAWQAVPAGPASRKIWLAVEAVPDAYLRATATQALAAVGNVVAAPSCAAAVPGDDVGVCVRLGQAGAGASQRALTVQARCASAACAKGAALATLHSCALQAVSGALVCPDDGLPAGDHCEPKGGAIPVCTVQPAGGAGSWSSSEADGSGEVAQTQAKALALRHAAEALGGEIGAHTAFRCQARPNRIRVDVFVPDAERLRLKRAKRNAVVGLFRCIAKPADACGEGLLAAVRALAQEVGVKVSELRVVAAEPDAGQLAEIAAKAEATAVFVVRLLADYKGVDKPYHVCRAQASATLWDAGSARATKEARPGGLGSDDGFKGLVFAGQDKPVKACERAVKAALEALRGSMVAWAEQP